MAAGTLNIEEALKFTMDQQITIFVSHTVSAGLTQKGNHWLSPSRFLKHQAVLTESEDVTIQVTDIFNPAAYFQGKATEEPVQHDCIETMEAVYSSHPDLKDSPLENADNWFTDESTYVKNGKRFAGYAITSTGAVLEANLLPVRASAHKAEIIALTGALVSAEGKPINIWTDSKYAFAVVRAPRAIWKERSSLTSQKKQIKHATEILHLLEALSKPSKVAIMHCKRHSQGNTIPELTNATADKTAKAVASKVQVQALA